MVTSTQTAMQGLSAEFRLVAACCMWPPSERRNNAIRDAAAHTMDWKTFLATVERHRVAGLVHDGLSRAEIVLPADTKVDLAFEAGKIARLSLQLAGEAVRLQDLLAEAGIPALFVKGTSLAILAYGNIALKHAWDVDVLVRACDIPKACIVLRGAGYVRESPPASFPDRRFQAWTEFAHESLFHRRDNDSFVELHWRLSYNPALLEHLTASAQGRQVSVSPNHSLKTLGDDDLFAYLCLHGAHHGWSRLKWLGDLAAWLSTKPAVEIERLYRQAKGAGVGRAPDQALLLCEMILGMPLPQALTAEMRASRVTRWLLSIALDAMVGAGATQTHDRTFGTLEIVVSRFFVVSNLRFWVQELRTKTVGWPEMVAIPLPRALFFLYPLLRIPAWIVRRAVHLFRRSDARAH